MQSSFALKSAGVQISTGSRKAEKNRENKRSGWTRFQRYLLGLNFLQEGTRQMHVAFFGVRRDGRERERERENKKRFQSETTRK